MNIQSGNMNVCKVKNPQFSVMVFQNPGECDVEQYPLPYPYPSVLVVVIDLFFIPSTGVRTDKTKTRTTVENTIPNIFL
jgi:hypothetical protein